MEDNKILSEREEKIEKVLKEYDEFQNNIDKILAACNYVYNQLGFGLSESAYNKALTAELQSIFDNVQSEFHIEQYFTTSNNKKIQVASLRIDIMIDNCFVLELKTTPSKLNEKAVNQCQRYIALSNISDHVLGFLVNFGLKELEFIQL